MSTPNENTIASDPPIFEPFPKTQTMPSGWDLSGLTSDAQPVSSPQGAPAAPADETSNE